MKKQVVVLTFIALCLIGAGVSGVLAQEGTAEPVDADLLTRGRYIADIAGCIGCHTPFQDAYNVPPAELTLEQTQTIALFAADAQDFDARLMAGGRPFDLGPAGVAVSRNLTPDEETGLGAWTDEEIEAAIRIGVSRDGRRLHPVMPYRNYYNMARQDMRALIAYLRTIPAVSNDVPLGPSGEGIAPELVPSNELMESAPADPVELGEYLVNTVMSCSDCHTPLDATTGAPVMDRWLAGGQPYEGPWGIVYGANITPHPERGIGNWTEAQILTVLYTGVRPDGRRLVLMPWQDYRVITESDARAVAAFLLTGLEAVDNEVPAPAIEEPFRQFVEVPAAAAPDNTPLLVGGGVAVLLVIAGAAFVFLRRSPAK